MSLPEPLVTRSPPSVLDWMDDQGPIWNGWAANGAAAS